MRTIWPYLILITWMMMCFMNQGFAQRSSVLCVDAATHRYPISKTDVGWFTDTLGTKSFHEIYASRWTNYPINFSTIIRTNGRIWTKFMLCNKDQHDRVFVLRAGKWGRIQAYLLKHGTIIHQLQTGSIIPLALRSFPSSHNDLLIDIPAQDTMEVYIGFHPVFSIYKHNDWQLEVSAQGQLDQTEQTRGIWQGVFFGIILVMIFYNLFIFITVKDSSYLYYVLSIISIGLYFLFYYGFGIEYIWPNAPRWDTFAFTVINPFTSITRILFTRTYLHTDIHLPRLNRFMQGLLLFCMGLMMTGLGCYLTGTDWLEPLVMLIGVTGALVLMMMMVAGYLTYRRERNSSARYFMAANILLVIGAIGFILRETGIMGDHFISRYLVQYAVLIQAVVLSLGLGSRLNRMRLQLAQEHVEKQQIALDREREKQQLIQVQKQELQQQVEEKTVDLQQKNQILETTISQLRTSQQQLAELNAVKDKLFSVVSHDLRNPLATMQSFLKLLATHQDKLSEEEKQKLYAEAQQSIDNLNILLYNLLQWSRSQMNMLEFRQVQLSVKQLVDNALRMVQLQAHMKEVKIHVQIPDQVYALADREMTEFILRNLLSNAIKFSHRQGNVHVLVQVEDQSIQVCVQDSGIGIQEAKVRKLLEKQVFLSRRGTEKEKGTGLGLLVSKEFIEKQGGTLQIHSEVGKGSKFCFTLRRYEV